MTAQVHDRMIYDQVNQRKKILNEHPKKISFWISSNFHFLSRKKKLWMDRGQVLEISKNQITYLTILLANPS